MDLTSHAWLRSARGLYLVAMAVFVVTVVIGILNGADVIAFDRNQLLTHVHAGTIGWITLGIVATGFCLFGAADGRLAAALAVVVPIYVAAFYSGNLAARAVTGSVLLLVILWLIVWAWRAGLAERSLPRLAVALGLTTFTYGALIGILLQVQLATGNAIFPSGGDVIAAHVATMVFSYLILVAMGVLEWRIKGTAGVPAAGLVQVLALFLGGLILAGSLLVLTAEELQAPAGLDALLQLVAVALFAVRVVPPAVRIDWLGRAPERFFAAASLFVIVAMILFVYVIGLAIQAKGDVAQIPVGVGLASDHSAFIGVMTNLLLGLVLSLAADRRHVWPWADQAVFWVMNAGLVVFLAGLIAESPILKELGAPVMGIAILVGLATAANRLWGMRDAANDIADAATPASS